MEELLFCCPLCGAPLAREDHAVRCPRGHSFDRARQGYVHLLPPSQMHAKVPGDSKEMVDSRRTNPNHSPLSAGPFLDRPCN